LFEFANAVVEAACLVGLEGETPSLIDVKARIMHPSGRSKAIQLFFWN
jgi:hypothetical protein